MDVKYVDGEESELEDFGSAKVKNLLVDEKYDKFSVAEVNVVGEQKFGLDKESDSVYYVLGGMGVFFIEDKEYKVKEGDLVFIPKNTKYKDTKGLKLLAISVPRFDREKRVRFEE